MRTLKFKATVIILIIILISSLFIGVKSCTDTTQTHPSLRKYNNRIVGKLSNIKDIQTKYLKPDIQSVYDDLVYYNVSYPEIALKQSIWETGWYKSKACIKNNNLFGFTHDGVNYLKFKSWEESIIYYKNWQNRNYKGGDYYNFLNVLPYSGDSLYTVHLKSIKVHVKKRRIPRIFRDTL